MFVQQLTPQCSGKPLNLETYLQLGRCKIQITCGPPHVIHIGLHTLPKVFFFYRHSMFNKPIGKFLPCLS